MTILKHTWIKALEISRFLLHFSFFNEFPHSQFGKKGKKPWRKESKTPFHVLYWAWVNYETLKRLFMFFPALFTPPHRHHFNLLHIFSKIINHISLCFLQIIELQNINSIILFSNYSKYNNSRNQPVDILDWFESAWILIKKS